MSKKTSARGGYPVDISACGLIERDAGTELAFDKPVNVSFHSDCLFPGRVLQEQLRASVDEGKEEVGLLVTP